MTYLRPSDCDRCVPVESYGDDYIEYAHEPTCPNRKDRSK